MINNKIVKQLFYRSRNRGCKENDIILGKFAEQILSSLSEEEILKYARFLDEDDHDIFDWVMNKQDTPQGFAELIDQIRKCHGI